MNSDRFVIFIDTIGSKKIGISSSFRSEFRSEYSELRRISDRKPIGSDFRANRRSRANLIDEVGRTLIDEVGRPLRSRANPRRWFDEVSKFRRSFEVATKRFDHGGSSDGPGYDGYGFFLFYRVNT